MRTSKTPIILYLCDGDDPNCKKTNCYKCGGDCKHTKDIAHAVNYSAETIRSVSAFGNEIIKVAYFENETPVIAGYDRALGADKTALATVGGNACGGGVLNDPRPQPRLQFELP